MKKKSFVILALIGASIFTGKSSFGQLQLPQPSPSASVNQTVGLTEIGIEYSSPGVKGRPVFGALVPFNEVWRTGANSSTKISFSKDVTIEGNKIPKGKYALFSIPTATEFTVILSKDLTASADSYKQEDDQARFVVKVKACEFRERLAFMFSNFSDSQTTIDMEWDKTRISFVVSLDTDLQAKDNIEKELGKTWRTFNSAARYYLDNKKEYETGMKYVDQSLGLKDEWFNNWTKAQLFAAMNKPNDAYKWALKSKELGDKSSNFFYKEQVEKALVDWKPTTDKKQKVENIFK
ncbi:MAG: DUF2911 domain-containing protein [Bacteroidetes bacterium]|nr:DUF2911 domain-containing protein [Bacteroidota bacterium]